MILIEGGKDNIRNWIRYRIHDIFDYVQLNQIGLSNVFSASNHIFTCRELINWTKEIPSTIVNDIIIKS